ncbi:hypothetical protein A9Q91_05165 [Candidatus Gracilibacteria bacterium 28_42_T64]|nr:hypothetical protein A9Q91_05165 [Candidatus Gracilibacteria bacterium 28_42_T64]
MGKVDATDEYWQSLFRFAQQLLTDAEVLKKCEKCELLIKQTDSPKPAQDLFEKELKENPDIGGCFNASDDMSQAITKVFDGALDQCKCNKDNKSE